MAGNSGDDLIAIDLRSDPAVERNLGAGLDTVLAVAPNAANQIRLTFTSTEVGNGSAFDSDTEAGQDGGLAVRLSAEDGSDGLAGDTSRFDDEGITFVTNRGITFDVRDLVTGKSRGDQFDVVRLGTRGDNIFSARAQGEAFYINSGMGNDRISGGSGDDFLVGGDGDDRLKGNEGDDTLLGGAGNDTALFHAGMEGSDTIDLGKGLDTVEVAAPAASRQVRLTFTSGEVGNGSAADGGAMAGQDGGLAVRLQAEDGSGNLVGSVSRFDDEGISFESARDGVTFDVRDLVSGAARGDQFDVVRLGTSGDNVFSARGEDENYYINAGMGDDRISGGRGEDFLVGGAGNDRLNGNEGDDSFIGGAGNDTIFDTAGDDTSIFNVATEGSDKINLGSGLDTVRVTSPLVAPNAAGQVRLTFTSSEVGNGNASDSNSMAGQDGGLAVRLQAEDAAGNLIGNVSRFDDEGISFESATPGVTFDVRDLVSGTARGDQFDVVRLGTSGENVFSARGEAEDYYINAGMGNDRISGGLGNDFLVGGAGNDRLSGLEGSDTSIGGAGMDMFVFRDDSSNDRILDFVSGTDQIDLRAFDIDFSNVATIAAGPDTRIGIDSDDNGVSNFLITLVNAAAPQESDFLFA